MFSKNNDNVFFFFMTEDFDGFTIRANQLDIQSKAQIFPVVSLSQVNSLDFSGNTLNMLEEILILIVASGTNMASTSRTYLCLEYLRLVTSISVYSCP